MIGKTVGHYKIVDKVGEGGMGAVYKAEDTTLERLVALKTLSPRLGEDEEARKRLVREAQAASALNHPNITTVHDLLKDEEQYFICMEYVEGKTIRDLLESGHVSIKKAVNIVLQVAEALEAAHKKGILHRDVKGSNIMLTMEGRAKVMDFGLAHLEEKSKITRTGTTMGTLAYSSPEQLTGRSYDERSEIWSLGVVFYELLTGQLPFKSRSEGELVFAIINAEQDSPSGLREDLPESIEAIVNRMLEKNPEQRYQTCSELVLILSAVQQELETTNIYIARAFEEVIDRSLKWSHVAIALSSVMVIAIIAIYFLIISPMRSSTPRLAILPIKLSGQTEDTYFSSGLEENLKALLSGMEGIDLIPTSSTLIYCDDVRSATEVGHLCDADYILDVSVQVQILDGVRANIRIIPTLIHVSGDRTVWCEVWERDSGESLVLQTDFSKQIADEVRNRLTEGELIAQERTYTNSQIAHDFYRRGLEYGIDKWQFAENMFKQALDEDPTFAQAWAELSYLYSLLGSRDELPDAFMKAKAAADNALGLYQDLASAHRALGAYYYWSEIDLNKALSEFQHALRLEPDNPDYIYSLGWVQRRLGKWDEAKTSFKEAWETDPRDPNKSWDLANTLCFMRHYPEAASRLNVLMVQYPDYQGPSIYVQSAVNELHNPGGGRVKAQEVLSRIVGDEAQYLEMGLNDFETEFRALCRILPDFFIGLLEQPNVTVDPRRYFIARAEIAYSSGEVQTARAYYDSVLSYYETEDLHPSRPIREATILIDKGKAHAALNHYNEAIQAGNSAREVLSISKDACQGTSVAIGQAEIYMMLGAHDSAIDIIEDLLDRPSNLSTQLIQIDPIWNPLNEYPRFIKQLSKH